MKKYLLSMLAIAIIAMLSNASEYGIRALIYLAAHQEKSTIPISEISERLNISFHFLTKILQVLTKYDYKFDDPMSHNQLNLF